MGDPVAEPALVEQLQWHAEVVRQRRVAAADDDWVQEQVDLVDETGSERAAQTLLVDGVEELVRALQAA